MWNAVIPRLRGVFTCVEHTTTVQVVGAHDPHDDDNGDDVDDEDLYLYCDENLDTVRKEQADASSVGASVAGVGVPPRTAVDANDASTAALAERIRDSTRGVLVDDSVRAEACMQLAIKLSPAEAPMELGQGVDVSVRRAERALACAFLGATQTPIPQTHGSLGRGAYSIVGAGEVEGRPVAIKVFYDRCIGQKPEVPLEVAREVATLRSLDHPCIVRVLALHVVGADVALVLPRGQMNLRDFVVCSAAATVHAVAPAVLVQIGSAIAHCHARGVLHRDVKPDNVLVAASAEGEAPHFALCDFNLARFYDAASDVRRTYTQNVVSLWYRPPELTLSSAPTAYGVGVDDWAFGCVLHELLQGSPAFRCPEEAQSVMQSFHLHFLNEPKVASIGCFCRGCRAREVFELPRSSLSSSSVLDAARALMRPANKRATAAEVVARYEGAGAARLSFGPRSLPESPLRSRSRSRSRSPSPLCSSPRSHSHDTLT